LRGKTQGLLPLSVELPFLVPMTIIKTHPLVEQATENGVTTKVELLFWIKRCLLQIQDSSERDDIILELMYIYTQNVLDNVV